MSIKGRVVTSFSKICDSCSSPYCAKVQFSRFKPSTSMQVLTSKKRCLGHCCTYRKHWMVVCFCYCRLMSSSTSRCCPQPGKNRVRCLILETAIHLYVCQFHTFSEQQHKVEKPNYCHSTLKCGNYILYFWAGYLRETRCRGWSWLRDPRDDTANGICQGFPWQQVVLTPFLHGHLLLIKLIYGRHAEFMLRGMRKIYCRMAMYALTWTSFNLFPVSDADRDHWNAFSSLNPQMVVTRRSVTANGGRNFWTWRKLWIRRLTEPRRTFIQQNEHMLVQNESNDAGTQDAADCSTKIQVFLAIYLISEQGTEGVAEKQAASQPASSSIWSSESCV